MHKILFGVSLAVTADAAAHDHLDNLRLKEYEVPSLDTSTAVSPGGATIIPPTVDPSAEATLRQFSDAANTAENDVNTALEAKGEAEKKHAEAQWKYSQNRGAKDLRTKVEEAFLALYKAKGEVERLKKIARVARIAYAKAVADIEAKSDNPIDMKGLDTDGNGTGIPGGLDAIGAEAANLFLPGTKLSQADVAFELNKLKLAYKKRKQAIDEWEKSQVELAEAGDEDSKANLTVLRERTKDRLVGAKNKTNAYIKTVKALYQTYGERYRERKLNRFQWEQIKTWVIGKKQLSNDRYSAFRTRVINKYKSQLERTNAIKIRKRKNKVKAKQLAKEQKRKNREMYQIAKKRLQLQGRVRGDSVFGQNGATAFSSIPSLVNLGDSSSLDPIGGLDPFADVDEESDFE